MSAYFSGSLVEAYGPQWVFGTTAIFPLIVSLSALLITEERSKSGPGEGDKPFPPACSAKQRAGGSDRYGLIFSCHLVCTGLMGRHPGELIAGIRAAVKPIWQVRRSRRASQRLPT